MHKYIGGEMLWLKSTHIMFFANVDFYHCFVHIDILFICI